VTNARGYVTTYLHNSLGLRTTEIDPLGNLWTTAYDYLGRPVSCHGRG
jgi:YD repeat-containing protein